MHVSCPMVLVINPIASSSDADDGACSNDGNGNHRATVAMDDAGEAVAGDCGDFVGRRSRDCGRHWQQQRSPFNLERHGSMQIIFIAQVETYGQYQSKPHQLLPMHNGTTNNSEIEFHVISCNCDFHKKTFYTWSCTCSSVFDIEFWKRFQKRFGPIVAPSEMFVAVFSFAGWLLCLLMHNNYCTLYWYLLVEVNMAKWKIQEPPIRLTIHTKSNSIQ